MRVIAADDELHVRRRLAQKVDWKGLGVDDLVLCDDGDEILERMEEKPADILLTDIRMARMNGIEAAREARKKYPKLAVILMSAYDDKEYLKSALDLQAVGYLEKPFSVEQAQELVKKAAERVRENKEASSAVGEEKIRRRRQREAGLAVGLCRYRSDYGQEEKEIEQLCPLFAASGSYYAVLFCRGGEQENEFSEVRENGEEVLASLLEECGYQGLCANMKNDSVLCILAAKREEIKEILRVLYRRMEEEKVSFRQQAAVGSQANGIASVYHSYQDAVITMERHFYHKTPVLYFEEKCTEPFVFTEEKASEYIFMLQNRNSQACLAYLDRLQEELLAHDGTLVRTVKNFYFRLALAVLQYRDDTAVQPVSEYYLWELFYQISSLEQLHLFLKELTEACLPAGGFRAGEVSISSILEYIEKNLQNPGLSLSEISRRYYMSVTYLCIYFKEKTGTTIKAYIIEKRMKKAAGLLKYTDMKISEVASAAGFADQSYFTKSFGKYYGKSPSRYKEEQCEKKP